MILDIGFEFLCYLGRKRKLSRNEFIFYVLEKLEKNR